MYIYIQYDYTWNNYLEHGINSRNQWFGFPQKIKWCNYPVSQGHWIYPACSSSCSGTISTWAVDPKLAKIHRFWQLWPMHDVVPGALLALMDFVRGPILQTHMCRHDLLHWSPHLLVKNHCPPHLGIYQTVRPRSLSFPAKPARVLVKFDLFSRAWMCIPLGI